MIYISRNKIKPELLKAIKRTFFVAGYHTLKFEVSGNIAFEIAYRVQADDAYVAGGDKDGSDLYDMLITAIEPLWIKSFNSGLIEDLDSESIAVVNEEFIKNTRVYINTKYSY